MCRKQDVRAMIISQKDKKDSATQTFGMDTRVDGIALSIKDAPMYGLLAIGFSLIAGYFLLNTYQSLTTFVANNALLVLMLLSSIVRPDNMMSSADNS
uniref:Uncharacterized protein n=1 Tax=Ditylenchus dipsaci TaxID=166011 RepID=A0A915EK39_9BILA